MGKLWVYYLFVVSYGSKFGLRESRARGGTTESHF